MTTFKELVADLGEKIGISDLAPSEDGVVSLHLNSHFDVHLETNAEADAIYLISHIGTLAEGVDPLPLYETLLEANLCGLGTLGCTLGMDRIRREIIISRTIYIAGLQLAQFLREFEIFLEAADGWVDRLQNLPRDLNRQAQPSLPSSSASSASSLGNSTAQAVSPT